MASEAPGAAPARGEFFATITCTRWQLREGKPCEGGRPGRSSLDLTFWSRWGPGSWIDRPFVNQPASLFVFILLPSLITVS